ncbi:MAG: hypothetical protein DRH12_11140, partial [Deltaproteobacteria bacterium]
EYLFLTAPDGEHYAVQGRQSAYDPPPLFPIANRPTTKAEILEKDWVRSVVIDDVRELFPVMKTDPGWYTLQVKIPFARYKQSTQSNVMGLVAFTDDPENWNGTVDSQEIQIYIAPSSGAQLNVKVVNRNVWPPEPVEQALVRVFRQVDIVDGYSDEDIWNNLIPVLEGKTDSEGWAFWDVGSACKDKDAYLAMSYYNGSYGKVDFEEDDPGWAPGCQAKLERTIFFGEAVVSNEFCILGLNSVWIRAKARILSGNVGVVDASEGPCLMGGVEVFIGPKVWMEDGVQVFGDSVKIKRKASVFDVFYNELVNKGTIRGEEQTPLDLPLEVYLPDFPDIQPGIDPVKVFSGQTRTLAEGHYGAVRVRPKGKLVLEGGEYHFEKLRLDPKASVVCLAPTEIRIEGRLLTWPKAYIGPAADSEITAKDIVILVGGINGRNGNLRENPKAVTIGIANNIKANIYAPNGTLWICGVTHAEGSFIGRDVIIGVMVTMSIDSAF